MRKILAKLDGSLPVKNARVRTGGQTIPLLGISSGSFVVPTGCTRYRLVADLRTYSSLLILIGYTSPVTQANASLAAIDLGTLGEYDVVDDVPEGTTVYFSVVDMSDLTPTACTANDALHISFYG